MIFMGFYLLKYQLYECKTWIYQSPKTQSVIVNLIVFVLTMNDISIKTVSYQHASNINSNTALTELFE